MAFNRDNRSGGTGGGFGRRRFDGGRGADRQMDRQMFKAICSNCGKECEVPFKPTGSKPVYCRDCFRTMGGSSYSRREDRSSSRPSFDNANRNSTYPQYKEQFETLNAKLDKILTLLNPEKSIEASKVAIVPHVKNEIIKVDIKPLKKKTKAKKQTPTESNIPTETPKK